MTVAAFSPRIARWLHDHDPSTPCLVLDLDVVARRYHEQQAALPYATPYYAVKANPQPAVIALLVKLGACFDVASPAEIDLCLANGADAGSLSYGNTIKKSADIAYAHQQGVSMFVFDNVRELDKIAEAAPGAAVYCRLLSESAGARWRLGDNFGCSLEYAVELMTRAAQLGLRPYGLSFHVGSQQLEPTRWEPNIAAAAEAFEKLRANDVELEMLNLGGGFPARYAEPVPPIIHFGRTIEQAIDRWFPGTRRPRIVTEPGRSISAEAGVLRTQVVSVREPFEGAERWVYLDAGRFGGLAETEGEAIQYQVETERGGPTQPVIMAGPTCDSIDVIYRDAAYALPKELQIGDRVDFLSAGAYTASYSSIGFNGFPPLPTHCIGGGS
ncbi:type III PLP-dependent enzyme [Amycolatopsis sp. lyj-84]|uniref:type III PLP-dependent enzyme n=1 Tax=Amycolatopsis sp. lyj-84 TaxID=2789284 RepID=UPI00397DF323